MLRLDFESPHLSTRSSHITSKESELDLFDPQGKLTKHNKFVRDLIREVAGFAPYERRAQELLRIGEVQHRFSFTKKNATCNAFVRRQGEEVPEVPEEEDRLARPRQEEEGGDAGGAAGHEEEGRRLIVVQSRQQASIKYIWNDPRLMSLYLFTLLFSDAT